MKRLLLLLLLALAPGCVHPPPTIVTPQGRIAFSADQAAMRIQELENAAIQANASAALPQPTTFRIVQFCVAAGKTLQAAPSGWPDTLWVAWKATKADLPIITNPAVLAAMSAVDVLLSVGISQ